LESRDKFISSVEFCIELSLKQLFAKLEPSLINNTPKTIPLFNEADNILLATKFSKCELISRTDNGSELNTPLGKVIFHVTSCLTSKGSLNQLQVTSSCFPDIEWLSTPLSKVSSHEFSEENNTLTIWFTRGSRKMGYRFSMSKDTEMLINLVKLLKEVSFNSSKDQTAIPEPPRQPTPPLKMDSTNTLFQSDSEQPRHKNMMRARATKSTNDIVGSSYRNSARFPSGSSVADRVAFFNELAKRAQ
jgi:hypothetical protein